MKNKIKLPVGWNTGVVTYLINSFFKDVFRPGSGTGSSQKTRIQIRIRIRIRNTGFKTQVSAIFSALNLIDQRKWDSQCHRLACSWWMTKNPNRHFSIDFCLNDFSFGDSYIFGKSKTLPRPLMFENNHYFYITCTHMLSCLFINFIALYLVNITV